MHNIRDELPRVFHKLQEILPGLKLSCKSGVSKCSHYWDTILTISHLNKQVGFNQCGAHSVQSMMIPWKSYIASLPSNWNPVWVITSRNLFGTNYVFKYHDICQYDLYEIPSQITTDYIYAASLVNQSDICIELSCWRTYLALIMLMSMDVQAYMTYEMQSKMPFHSYSIRLVNQDEIPIESSCKQADLVLIISLTSMKVLSNIDHMRYHWS